ncbi:MAG: OmpA family protein [Chitinophagaceae bacterium]|nr:OmpA family protein [Chitinophagaceae bacterium]
MNTTPTLLAKSKEVIMALLLLLSINLLHGQDIEGGGTKAPEIGGYSKAEKLYNALAYHEAIPLYESYLQKHDSARAMAHLGDCYRLTSRYDKAEYWYSKAVSKGDVEPKYKLYLAQMEQVNGKYEDAAKWYAKYKEEVPEDRRSTNEMKACSDYGQFLLSRDRYTVKNLSFNSGGYDFSSASYDGGLIFSSSRDSAKAISREHTWTGTEFFDMWYVKGDKTSFGKPQRLKGDAATKYHEGAVSFTGDSKKVYYTRNNYFNNKVKTSSDKIVKLKIYESDVDGRTWKNDKSFAFNNDEYSVGHPALTADGNTMYFVSDMPGGYGSTDIYVTKKEGETWSTPKNVGPDINTEGREMFPYVDKDGELYFSSDAHGGLGGLDIFRVKPNVKTGKWGKIRNIGAPINSSYDDFSLHYGTDKSYGYFTSDRPDGHGLDDIYTFTDDGIFLEGIVVDAETGEPICASKVLMKAKADGSERGRVTTECDGEFEFNVVRNTDYQFSGSADGYNTNDSVTATTKGVGPGGKVFVKIPLTKKKNYAMSITVLGRTPKSPKDSAGTLIALPNAKILLSSQCEGWTKAFTTDANGKICEEVRCDCDYIVVANAKDYLPGSTSVLKDDKECVIDRKCGVNPKEVEVILDAIPGGDEPGGPIELKDIYYDFDKWYIRTESEGELGKLLGFMQENPDAIVEIGSHTDARAPFDYNIKLSQRRAQSVVDWLIARGVSKSRLKPKGYGETQPRNGCTDGVPCSEYEHQRNRRTEFRVVGGNINVKSLERFDMQVDPCKVCPF